MPQEEGDIQISSLDFIGVEQVDKGALKNVLQTKEGSWIPWGRKRYFDRRAFEADLKRIQAYYGDRGYPDARVASFDVKLNDTQDKVDIAVHISEGEPILVAGVELQAFDVLPENERAALVEGLPLRPEQPLDRQLELATRERALNVLRDSGYPVRTGGFEGRGGGPAPAHDRARGDTRHPRAVRPYRDRRPAQRGRARHPPAAHLRTRRALHASRDA